MQATSETAPSASTRLDPLPPNSRVEPSDAVQFVNPPGVNDPRPYGYSHLAVFPADWRLILPAGQGGHFETGELPPSFEGQLRQALKNTAIVLAAAGARMMDVAKFNLLVVDHGPEKLAAIRTEFQHVWGDTKPAWTLIPVPTLALEGMLVEIDVLAVVPDRSAREVGAATVEGMSS